MTTPTVRGKAARDAAGIVTYIGFCCREWVMAAGIPFGSCGLCGERPTYLREDMTTDPAVDIWLAAINEVIGRDRRPRRIDRRTPFEVERDNRLEDIAEARADHDNCDYDALADEAADRYERGLGL